MTPAEGRAGSRGARGRADPIAGAGRARGRPRPARESACPRREVVEPATREALARTSCTSSPGSGSTPACARSSSDPQAPRDSGGFDAAVCGTVGAAVSRRRARGRRSGRERRSRSIDRCAQVVPPGTRVSVMGVRTSRDGARLRLPSARARPRVRCVRSSSRPTRRAREALTALEKHTRLGGRRRRALPPGARPPRHGSGELAPRIGRLLAQVSALHQRHRRASGRSRSALARSGAAGARAARGSDRQRAPPPPGHPRHAGSRGPPDLPRPRRRRAAPALRP